MNANDCFKAMGMDPKQFEEGDLEVTSPIDGEVLGRVQQDTKKTLDKKIALAAKAFEAWKVVPAPERGELVRLLGEELRTHKDALGRLVTLENGKLLSEGLGEVQEMIDICDFAVGLSRQLYGLTIASERAGHNMRENWHPLGVVGVISAFNFPVAVWAWNAALALVCGDPVIWKPSDKTPLTAIATQHLLDNAIKKFGKAPKGLSQLAICGRAVASAMVEDPRVPLISATGSTAMGRTIGPIIAGRFGRTILELGGNNAIIVAPTADLDLALRGILFGAVGTCGQRCTSTRRLLVHESIYDNLVPKLKKAYANIPTGNPLEDGILIGPLIDEGAFNEMENAIAKAGDQGGKITGGGRAPQNEYPNAYYVHPAIVEMTEQTEIVHDETFAPILYILKYQDFADAVAMQNAVPQGLSSAIFTNDVREAEFFTSAAGSDCGIANVNIGTSGAEIGGAFGGEKETGGGRESGSDSWKAYMRRSTSTTNYTSDLPLAQGVKFDID
ncbi:MAG: aldehyde dehydrogenase family protein [Sphingomonadales bacterium]